MNLFTLRIKFSSVCKYSSRVNCLTICSDCRFPILRTSRDGNRSLIMPVKIGISSVTILCKLKSLKMRISTWKKRVNNLSQEHKIIFFRSLFSFKGKTPETYFTQSSGMFLSPCFRNYQNWLDSMKSPVITDLQRHFN